MNDYENPVAVADDAMEQPADDAQAADVVTAEELLANLTDTQTAENEGDGDQQAGQASDKGGEKDKFEARIRSALANQKAQYLPDVGFAARIRGAADGMTEDEIMDVLRTHQARKMHEADPDISEKAARKILDAKEAAKNPTHANAEAYRQGVQALLDDGWTQEELVAFSTDPTVHADLAAGKTLRAAATGFLRRGAQAAQTEAPEKKRGVPTVRRAATKPATEANAIETMSDDEFRKLREKIKEGALSGKKYRL